MDINSIKKDVKKATDGTWLPFGSDAAVRIAAWMNPKHQKFIRDLVKVHGRKASAVTDEQSRELLAPQWKFVVTDFKGFTQGDQPIEYSESLLEEWARDPEYDDLFEAFAELAKDKLNHRQDNILELGEILPTTLVGITDGREV